MPQLDKFAFAPQVFWLVLVFFTLYLLLLKDGLSTLYRVLVFRRRLILDLSLTSSGLAQEIVLIKLFSSKFLASFIFSRTVSEFFFKLLDTILSSVFRRSHIVFSNRENVLLSDVTLVYLVKRQFIAPALAHYSTIKL